MAASIITEAYTELRGGLTVLQSLNVPSGSITNDAFSTSSTQRLAASKSVHQQHMSAELAEQNTAVAAIEKLLFIANASGTLDGFSAAVVTVADDASRTIDVDLQKSTGGGAFTTVLSASSDFTNSSTALTAVDSTISSASYVAGDIFKIVVTVAGGSGNQAKGLIATLTKSENPN